MSENRHIKVKGATQLKNLTNSDLFFLVNQFSIKNKSIINALNRVKKDFPKAKKHLENLTLDEFISLEVYFSRAANYFKLINEFLYKDEDLSVENLQKKYPKLTKRIPYLLKTINMLRFAIDKSPKYEGIVYRGTDLYSESVDSFRSRMKIGNIIEMKGFTSSSTSRIVAEKIQETIEGRVFFTIKSKNGINSKLNPTEQEILFIDHSKFKVLDFDEKLYNNTTYFDVELEEI